MIGVCLILRHHSIALAVMTNKLKLLTASLLILSAGCTDRGELDFIQYKMVNNSRHKITLTVESINFPSEVILQDGESHEWQNPIEHGNSFQPLSLPEKVRSGLNTMIVMLQYLFREEAIGGLPNGMRIM